ncbi:MAG: hypothetical protein ACK2T3_07100, partial [Candidatus Promineifilaceae bacterium]
FRYADGRLFPEGAGEGPEAHVTRRRVLLSELQKLSIAIKHEVGGKDTGGIMSVIAQFGRHRLLTFDHEPSTREPTVEIAHEALLNAWSRLRSWLDESRSDLQMQRVLSNAVKEWIDSGQNQDYLLSGSKQEQFSAWEASTQLALTQEEARFLEQGESEKRKAEAEEAARLAREAELEKRSANRLRLLAGVMVVATAIALLLTFFALNQREEAEQKAREASARELASLSLRNLAVDPERSILLAMESVSKTYAFDGTTLPEAEDALHQALLAHRLVRTYKGTYPESCSGVIWCSAVAFSRDGHYLAISGEEDDVIIRDIEHPDSPLILTGHNGPVTDLSFGSTGDQLAVASANGDATIWKLSMLKDPSVSELSSGTVKRSVFSGHSGEIVAVDISPDGRLLATGSRDQLAKVWDIESGREVLSLDGHEGSVRDLAFSPDGRHLATASSDMTAIIWDIGTGDAVQVLEGHTDRLFGLDYSEDGEQLATASRDGSVVIWDLADNNDPVTIVSPGDHGGPVYAVAFSPDGRSLATAGVDATAKIWELPTGRRMLSLSGHEGTIYSLDFRPDGENLATGSIDNSVKIWDIRPEGSREWMTLDAHEQLVFDVVFSPDGGRIGSTSFDGTAKIWDTSTGEELIVLEGHQGPSSAIAFSPDQLLVATASFDGTAIVWDLDSSQPVAYLTGHQGPVNDVAFTRDGKEVVTAGFDGTARVWDARTGQELRQMIGHEGGIERVSVNPVEDQLATVGIDGTARVWQLSSGDEIGRLIGHQGPVLGLAYSMHGTQLVTTGADRSLKVWNLTALGDDVVSDKPIVINEVAYQLMGHTSDVWGVVSSPEQGMLATISFDGTARLWDISDPQHPNEHLVLGGWNDGREIAFSPDGKLLATTSSDGTIKVYVLPIEDLMDLAGERVTRGLSEEECRRYLHQEGCGASRQGES